MDALAARFRTGETLWNFSNQNRRTANRLEERGLISTMGGNTGGTFRASLTEKGRKAVLSPTYTAPIAKMLKDWHHCDLCKGTFYLGEHYCTGPKG